jgi:Zn-dependent peptidase ImmA (M78 family)
VIERVLQRAREMGLDQDLANLSGLCEARVDGIRSGEPLSSSEFELICRALAVDSGAMYSGDASNPERSPARFRVASTIEGPSPTDVRVLALAAEQGRILGHLMDLLGRPVLLQRHRKIEGLSTTADLWREGYDLGESARDELAPGGGPLHDLPGLFNDFGVHVARVRLNLSVIDAASIWEPRAVPVVLVNSTSHVLTHPGPFRASLAHELCHLLHDAGERNLTTSVSWGSEGTGNYDDGLEKRARAFAPAFLAPRPRVSEWHASLAKRLRDDATRMIQAMAEHWGLSFEGAAWHAKNCGLVEPEQAQQLARMPRKPLISLEEFDLQEQFYPPIMFDPELPEKAAPLWQGWASRLVLEALEDGHISIGRAREILTWG